MNLTRQAAPHPRLAGYQAGATHHTPLPETLAARFCDDHNCRPDEFAPALLRLCLSRRALPLLLLLPNSGLFEADRELIHAVEQAVAMEEVRDAIDDYWSDSVNNTWLRRAVGLRVSTSRLRRVASEYLPFTRPQRARRARGTAP